MASRENHYVPRWYQEGFFEPGKRTLTYRSENVVGGHVVTAPRKADIPNYRYEPFLDSHLAIAHASQSDARSPRALRGLLDFRRE